MLLRKNKTFWRSSLVTFQLTIYNKKVSSIKCLQNLRL